jgi:hypothetical protein
MLGAAFSLLLNLLHALLYFTLKISRFNSNKLIVITPRLSKTTRTRFRQHTHIVDSTVHINSSHARLQPRIVLSKVGGG